MNHDIKLVAVDIDGTFVRSFPLKEGENKTEIPFLSVYLSRERKIDMPRALSLPSMT